MATASDDFTRANETPLAGNWWNPSIGGGPGRWNLSGNLCVPNVTQDDCKGVWKASVDNFGDDQFSEVTLSVTGSSSGTGAGVCLRADETGTNGTQYRIVANHAATQTIEIARFNGGTFTQLATLNVASWTNGDTFRAEISGYVITVKINGVTVGSYDDSASGSKIASGQPGMAYSSIATAASVDNWQGGDLDAGVPPQELYPDADIDLGTAPGNWTPTPAWSRLDEASPDGDTISASSADGRGQTAGPSFPGSGTSETSGDANEVPWTTPGNITADDTAEAQITAATFDSPDPSYYLVASNFGFNIPANALVRGIMVEINRRSIIANSGVDNELRLRDSTGTLVGNNKATATVWPTGLTTVTYGGAADGWGANLDAADINSANFGFALQARANIANADIAVEWVRVTVTYDTPQETDPARLSLASGTTPDTQTNHVLKAKARYTSGVTGPLFRAELWEGSTKRAPSSGVLEATLTNILADISLAIADVDAATITDYGNLEYRFWGRKDDGMPITYEVERVWLEIPSGATMVAGSDVSGTITESAVKDVAISDTDASVSSPSSAVVAAQEAGADVNGAVTESATYLFFLAGSDANATSPQNAVVAEVMQVSASDANGTVAELATILYLLGVTDINTSVIENGGIVAAIPGTDTNATSPSSGALSALLSGADINGVVTELAAYVFSLAGTDASGPAQQSAIVGTASLAGSDTSLSSPSTATVVFFAPGVDQNGAVTEDAVIAVAGELKYGSDAGELSSEVASIVAALTAADSSSTEVTLASMIATLAGAEHSGTITENAVSVIFIAAADVNAASPQNAVVVAAIPASDTGSDTESGAVAGGQVFITGNDTGAGADLVRALAKVAADAGSGIQLATVESLLGASDVGSSVQNAVIPFATIPADDVATALETISLSAQVAGQDSGSSLEYAIYVLASMLAAIETGRIHQDVTGRIAPSGKGKVIS